MAEQPRDPNEQHQPHDPLSGDVPVEEDVIEPEAPRRAASAEFQVDAEVGSEAALREAMDPANQSLAEALRLSFRVLQMVVVVLVVLFFASGFQTVDEGESGVMTRWGRIVEVDGQMALTPGLKFSALPYPISEFVTFQAENRTVNLREPFWPRIRPGQSLDDATEQASTHDMLRPGESGYVITRDGDLAHARISANYNIESPVEYVQTIRDAEADRLVRLALQRALVHVAAGLTLQEFIDLSDDVRLQVHNHAQEVLDGLRSGITLARVDISDAIPPLAIRRIFGELPQAQEEAQTSIQEARRRAAEKLLSAAGERYRDLSRLITRYEESLQLGEEDRAAALLAELNEAFDSGRFAGEVARTIEHARAYRAHIDQTLGNEFRRFQSLLPAFRSHPELVIKQRWLETYSRVLARQDAEIWYVPADVGHMRLDLASLHELKELRQRLNLDRKEQRSIEEFYRDTGHHMPWLRDTRLDPGPGRQLGVEGGRVRPLGERGR